jgi:hypothetical protein
LSDFIPNSFQVPNILVDELLSGMTEAELKCYMVIIRKTTGWHKEEDRISISQFQKISGLSNRAVITACANLEEVGLIKVSKDPKGNKSYGLVRTPYEKSSHPQTYEKSSWGEKSSQASDLEPMKNLHAPYEESSQVGHEKSSHTKDTLTKNTNQKESSPRTRKNKTSIPEDFGVSEAVLKWAAEQGHTHLQQHLESFVDKAKSKQYQYADWDAAFREAIRKNWAGVGVSPGKSIAYSQQPAPNQPQRQTESPKPESQPRVSLFAGLEALRFNDLRKLDPEVTQIQIREIAQRQGLDVVLVMDQLTKQLKGQGAA